MYKILFLTTFPRHGPLELFFVKIIATRIKWTKCVMLQDFLMGH